MKHPLKNILSLFLLAAVLVMTGCDSNNNDPISEPDTLNGRWTATASEVFQVGYGLPEWASVDSVKYGYDGTQVFTMELEEGSDAAVTGTITWDEDASYTVTEYAGGTSEADTDVVNDTKTAAITGTYSDSVLRLTFDNPALSTLFEEAEIVFEDGVGSVQLVRLYLSKTYVGAANNQGQTIDFIVPLNLRFTRVRTGA